MTTSAPAPARPSAIAPHSSPVPPMTTATSPVRENSRFRNSAEDIDRWPPGATSVAPTMSWPMITETEMSVVGRESHHGYLDSEEIARIVREGLALLPVD